MLIRPQTCFQSLCRELENYAVAIPGAAAESIHGSGFGIQSLFVFITNRDSRRDGGITTGKL